MAMLIGLTAMAAIVLFVISVPIYALLARIMPRAVAAVAAPFGLVLGLAAGQVGFLQSDPVQPANMSIQMTLLMFGFGIAVFIAAALLIWVRTTVPRPKKIPES